METISVVKCPHCGDMWEANKWSTEYLNYFNPTDCHRCGGIYTIHRNWKVMFRYVYNMVKHCKGEK